MSDRSIDKETAMKSKAKATISAGRTESLRASRQLLLNLLKDLSGMQRYIIKQTYPYLWDAARLDAAMERHHRNK